MAKYDSPLISGLDLLAVQTHTRKRAHVS